MVFGLCYKLFIIVISYSHGNLAVVIFLCKDDPMHRFSLLAVVYYFPCHIPIQFTFLLQSLLYIFLQKLTEFVMTLGNYVYD